MTPASVDIRKATMIFVGVDKHVSPSEVLTFIDLFSEVHVLLYSNVTPRTLRRLLKTQCFREVEETRRSS